MKKIKIIAFVVIIVLTLSNCYKSKEEKNDLTNKNFEKHDKKIITQKWIQYKRRPVDKLDDQPPYNSCYFQVHENKFYYYKNDSLEYIDEFVKDVKLNRTIFKKYNLDEIIFDKDSNEVVLKRDNYEGEYEYFKKEK